MSHRLVFVLSIGLLLPSLVSAKEEVLSQKDGKPIVKAAKQPGQVKHSPKPDNQRQIPGDFYKEPPRKSLGLGCASGED